MISDKAVLLVVIYPYVDNTRLQTIH